VLPLAARDSHFALQLIIQLKQNKKRRTSLTSFSLFSFFLPKYIELRIGPPPPPLPEKKKGKRSRPAAR
jgi:hypothetical protein